jgi:hypothetical protein
METPESRQGMNARVSEPPGRVRMNPQGEKKWKRKEDRYRYEHETWDRIYESQAVKPGFVLRGGVLCKGEVMW